MEPPVLDDLHKPILSLFRFDANLGYAPVFHTLELTEGGGATETVAARGNAVVIEVGIANLTDPNPLQASRSLGTWWQKVCGRERMPATHHA